MDIHKRENLTIVFRFMVDVEKIPLVNIGKEKLYRDSLLGINELITVEYTFVNHSML